jgi:tyrosyl-tRNA synthetase
VDAEERVALASRNAEEIVEPSQLKALFESGREIRGYIGYEPSGFFHIGQGLITGAKILDLIRAGVKMTVFLADWHAYINDKLGGSMEAIRTCAEYLKVCFKAVGIEEPQARYLYANDLVKDPDYWQLVLDVGQNSSLSRTKRAITIMGRKEDEADLATAKLFYPLMQVADIFHMKMDIAYAGMDQRRAHMLCRDVAPSLKKEKPVALHTPLLPSMLGAGRMEMDAKMSKSKPETAVFFHDPPERVKEKVSKAFCPPKEVDGNPVIGIAKFILFPMRSRLKVERPAKFGGDREFASYGELEAEYKEGKLHPQDLKAAVARDLEEALAPIRAKVVGSREFRAMSEVASPP